MSEPILTTKDLKKSYGDFEAVKGISFSVLRGEIFSLLGPNGAGKTTTVAKLARLLKERERKKVAVVSADVYRPAAREQLATLGKENGLAVFRPDSDDPEQIVRLALDESRRRGSRLNLNNWKRRSSNTRPP